MHKINNIEAFILCGGKSQRFGSDKALVKLHGKTLIEIITDEVKKVFDKVTLIAADKENYKFLELDCAADIYPGRGPLAGIHSALKNSSTDRIFVISCDLPMMKAEIISYIATYNSESGIVIPAANGRKHYLCAVYKKSVLKLAEELLEDTKDSERSASPYDLISLSGYDVIDFDNQPQFSTDSFFNLNSREDLEELERQF